jgi:hypothetical protein
MVELTLSSSAEGGTALKAFADEDGEFGCAHSMIPAQPAAIRVK